MLFTLELRPCNAKESNKNFGSGSKSPRNLISLSLSHVHPTNQVSRKLLHNVLSNLVNGKETTKLNTLVSAIGVGNNNVHCISSSSHICVYWLTHWDETVITSAVYSVTFVHCFSSAACHTNSICMVFLHCLRGCGFQPGFRNPKTGENPDIFQTRNPGLKEQSGAD